ncbi:MAG: phosphoglycolate phosphatase [Pseudoxanthomonas sp.]
MTLAKFPRFALFDLDGTLLDSAPDMLATVNRMREARGMPPMALEEIRPHVSRGSRAMSAAAFPDFPLDRILELVPEFLGIYQQQIGKHSRLFDGVADMLDALECNGTTWGIVTNKPEYLARDILPQLGWETRCAVLIGGDTLAEKKPHPLPLQVAAQRIGALPAQCVYVGDDLRDIQAAQAAGMRSIAVLWGYRLPEESPADWGADVMVEDPEQLISTVNWPQPASSLP